MNTICAKRITSYNRQILNIFIDDCPLDEYLYKKTGNPIFQDLWCAWLLNKSDDVESNNDSTYMWMLIDEKKNCNIPVLLCPDDMDFWCTTVIAKVHFYDEEVAWEKIGLLDKKVDVKQWRESGIQNIEKWSAKDWELYGNMLSSLDNSDKAWEEWWSAHWEDEHMRRLLNYFHIFFNDDKNILWLSCEQLVFSRNEYETCISMFRGFDY